MLGVVSGVIVFGVIIGRERGALFIVFSMRAFSEAVRSVERSVKRSIKASSVTDRAVGEGVGVDVVGFDEFVTELELVFRGLVSQIEDLFAGPNVLRRIAVAFRGASFN